MLSNQALTIVLFLSLRKALSHPALLHSALLLTAIEHSIQIKTMEPMKWLFLYHKDALYRFVQEQIRSPETAMQDVTMAAISTMCLADVSPFSPIH